MRGSPLPVFISCRHDGKGKTMKVLLREWENEPYVWKEAEWDGEHYNVEGCYAYPTDILATDGSDHQNYVMCKFCGAKIPNNPESIEKHFAEKEAMRDCLKCKNVAPYSEMSVDSVYTPNGDGTYSATRTSTVMLKCRRSYTEISKAYTGCQYTQCRKLGVSTYGDILMNFPDMFDTLITVDALKEKGYQYVDGGHNGFHYDLKCRGTLFAVVNEYGIVDRYVCTYRNYRYTFYYSSKYNKLFFDHSGSYDESKPYSISDTKYEQVKAKIASLYKEVK